MNLDGQGSKPSFFDVPYALVSAKLTAGMTIVTTTAADYWGFTLIAVTSASTIQVFNATASTGASVDFFKSDVSTRIQNQTPVRARIGLTVSITGTGSSATIQYTPKG